MPISSVMVSLKSCSLLALMAEEQALAGSNEWADMLAIDTSTNAALTIAKLQVASCLLYQQQWPSVSGRFGKKKFLESVMACASYASSTNQAILSLNPTVQTPLKCSVLLQ